MPIDQLFRALAAVEHGPDMHGGILVTALLAIPVVAALVYLIVKGRRRER